MGDVVQTPRPEVRLMLYLILGTIIFVGSGLIIGPEFIDVGRFKVFLPHFGIAFLISGILGLTVERYIRKKFTERLAKDVFEASIGYILPAEFQDEMRWIYGQDAICEEHHQEVVLEDLGNGEVKFTCQTVRHIRNISGKEIEVNLGLGIDEWFASQNAQITEFGYRLEGASKVDFPTGDLADKKMEKDRPIIAVKPKKIRLPKDNRIAVFMEFHEIKPINSDHHFHFSYSTKNPSVRVRTPDYIGAVVAFPRETATNKTILAFGTYTYDGLVLSGAEIRIRWWEKAKLNSWLNPPVSAS